ncbi:MAG: hypothetical protein MI919_28525, partial [Holophagales bacterium]|nr:hypothetical protein [Holophagales bacterium]
MSQDPPQPPDGPTARAPDAVRAASAEEILRAIDALRACLGSTASGPEPGEGVTAEVAPVGGSVSATGAGGVGAGGSIPAPPADPALLGPWLERLRRTVVDLAHDRRDLRHQLSSLIEIVEARSEDWQGNLPTPGPESSPLTRQESTARTWLKSRVHGGAHAIAGLLRLLRLRLLPPARLVLAKSDSAPTLPTLGWLRRGTRDATSPGSGALEGRGEDRRATAGAVESGAPWAVEGCNVTGGEASPTFRLLGERGTVLAEGRLDAPDALRHHCRSEVCLDLGPAPPGAVPEGWILLALLTLAAEELRFLHLRGGSSAGAFPGPAGGLVFARWSWWHPETGLDRERLERGPAGEILGKVVD